MKSKAASLKIFVSSTDKIKETLLYEWIVFHAKKNGMGGTTVTRGIMGFGASSVIHSYKFWELTEKVPVVIELVDEEQKLLSFYETILPQLEQMRYGCMVTLSPLDVLLYKSGTRRIMEQ